MIPKFEPREEHQFQAWFDLVADTWALDGDPDEKQVFYDYRAAYRAGVSPEETEQDLSPFRVPQDGQVLQREETDMEEDVSPEVVPQVAQGMPQESAGVPQVDQALPQATPEPVTLANVGDVLKDG